MYAPCCLISTVVAFGFIRHLLDVLSMTDMTYMTLDMFAHLHTYYFTPALEQGVHLIFTLVFFPLYYFFE